MVNFWKALPHPFFVLAPMEDVTDFVFREVVATLLPRPHVLFTEFTSSDGVASVGFERVATKLRFSENQRPIVAQLWGNNPEKMFEAARIVQELGFDGLDINMGCPERNLVRKGMGAGIIGNYSLVTETIDAARRGANKLPISVKTRLGIREIVTEEWFPFLLSQKLSALTVHGRVASQMSEGEANWEEIGKVVNFRDKLAPLTLIIGNGDVKSLEEAKFKHEHFGVDGVMIARGIFQNPWIFGDKRGDSLEALLKHAQLFDTTWGKTKNFEILKKFFKMYVRDFDGALELRVRLMECKNLADVEKCLSEAANS